MSDTAMNRNGMGSRHLQCITCDNIKEYFNIMNKAINLYIEIFQDPPYEEDFKYDEVKSEFEDYIKNGELILTILKDQQEVLGFIAIKYKFTCDKTIKHILSNNGIDCDKDPYISELGVNKKFRRQGIAKELIKFYLNMADNKNIYLRTGKYNNDKVIQLYQKYNFTVVPNLTEKVTTLKLNGKHTSDDRIYMVKITITEELRNKTKTFLDSNATSIDTYHSSSHSGYNSGAEAMYGDEDENSGYKSGAEYLY